ncbi:MAG: MFS transporter [Thermoplasmata archaeon]
MPDTSRLLRGIYLSTLFSMVSYALVTVTLPFRFEALGFSVFQYGVVLSVYAFGMLAMEGLWGALAFRIGRARPIIVFGAVVAAVLLAIGLSSSVIEFAVTLGLLGMFVIFPVPLMRWLALTARGPGTAGSGTGRYGLFFGGGLVIGAAVGPVLFVEIGFLMLSLLAVGLSVVSTVWLVVLPWKDLSLPPRELGARREVRSLLTPQFVTAAALVVLFYVSYSLPINFLQYYSVDLFGGTTTQAGYLVAATRGTALVAGFFLGPSVDRWGPPRVAPAGFILVIGGALGTFFSTTYPEMLAFTVVFGVGAGWLSANLLPLALGTVPRSAQGTAVGVFGSFEDLGLLIGPVMIGAVYSSFGGRAIFPVVALVALIGCVVAFGVRRRAVATSSPAPSALPGRG